MTLLINQPHTGNRWLRSYLLAEVVSLLVAVISITVANKLTSNLVILVALSVYSGSIGYYGILVGQRLLGVAEGRRSINAIRALVWQWGSAELLDSLLYSPVLLYLCLRLLPNQQLAVVVSEIASTTAFYLTLFLLRCWQQRQLLHTRSMQHEYQRTELCHSGG